MGSSPNLGFGWIRVPALGSGLNLSCTVSRRVGPAVVGFADGEGRSSAKERRWLLEAEAARKWILSYSLQKATQPC